MAFKVLYTKLLVFVGFIMLMLYSLLFLSAVHSLVSRFLNLSLVFFWHAKVRFYTLHTDGTQHFIISHGVFIYWKNSFCFCFWEEVHYGEPGVIYVDLAGLKLQKYGYPWSPPWVLRLKACTTMPGGFFLGPCNHTWLSSYYLIMKNAICLWDSGQRLNSMIPDMACRMRTFSEEFGGQCPIRLDRRHLYELSSDIGALGVPSHVMGLEDLQTSRLRGEHKSHWRVSTLFLLDGGWLSFWENKCACVEGDSGLPLLACVQIP